MSEITRKKASLQKTAKLAMLAKKSAQEIFMSLLEIDIDAVLFCEKIKYISHDHYDDIVYERSITGLCGYAVCNNAFIDEFPDQTYIIRNNEVYDVTCRRYFCSNVCYEASDLVKTQIPLTPLYLRANDPELKEFNIVLPDVNKLMGKHGKLINIKGPFHEYKEDLEHFVHKENMKNNKRMLAKANNLSYSSDTSTHSYSPGSTLSKCSLTTDSPLSSIHSESQDGSHFSSLSHDKSQHSIEVESDLSDQYSKLSTLEADDELSTSIVNNTSFSSNRGIKPAAVGDKDKRYDGKVLNKEDGIKGHHDKRQIILQVEHFLREWMTFESLIEVLGDTYVRGMLKHLGETWTDYENTAGMHLGTDAKCRYIVLCKKLDMEEKKEQLMERKEGEVEQEREGLRPMLDYQRLLKDSNQQQLKVKAFYEGSEIYADVDEDLTLPTIEEEETKEHQNSGGEEEKKSDKVKVIRKGKKNRKKKSRKTDADEIESVTLPMVDSCAQHMWRRHIVMEKINIVMPDLVCSFGLLEREVGRLLSSLVATFDFSPRNILLQYIQWKVVAVVLLKMLSVRYHVIADAFCSSNAMNYIKDVLDAFELDVGYLDRILSYLTEVQYIIKKTHKHNEDQRIDMHRETVSNVYEKEERKSSSEDRNISYKWGLNENDQNCQNETYSHNTIEYINVPEYTDNNCDKMEESHGEKCDSNQQTKSLGETFPLSLVSHKDHCEGNYEETQAEELD